jgi:hypothetical protein
MLQQWRFFKQTFLWQHARCRRCAAEGKTYLATEVVHTVVHAGDPAVMMDPSKCLPLCAPCAGGRGYRAAAVPHTIN